MGSDEDDSISAGLSSGTVEGASRRGIESQQRAEQGLSRVINAKLAAAFRKVKHCSTLLNNNNNNSLQAQLSKPL